MSVEATLNRTWKATSRRHLPYSQQVSGWEARHTQYEQARFGTEQILQDVENFFGDTEKGEFLPEQFNITNDTSEEVTNQ